MAKRVMMDLGFTGHLKTTPVRDGIVLITLIKQDKLIMNLVLKLEKISIVTQYLFVDVASVLSAIVFMVELNYQKTNFQAILKARVCVD